MKFRKTTATLLAAVLIAMIGVMPALATTDTVTLTVEVEQVPIISIEITDPVHPHLLDFGTLRPSDVEYRTVIIQNVGTCAIDLVSDVSGAFFIPNLGVTADLTGIAADEYGIFNLTLTIPASPVYATHDGTILFTASEAGT